MADLLQGNTRYVKVKDLNSGSFGTVVLCKDVQENRHVAIKFIPRKSVTQYVERELMTHRLLWHPHVIKLYKVFLTSTHLAVVLEYADCGDMYDYVSKRGRLSESSARWIFQQLMNTANRDIKLENTLLSGNLDKPLVKLCDMGFAKHTEIHSAPDSQVGTPSYFAPEVVEQKRYDGRVADIWSCGVMLYVMLYGAYPFERAEDSKLTPAKAQQALLNRIRATDYQLFPHVKVSDSAKDLIRHMLVKDTSKRFTIQQIFQHPFFAEGLPPGVAEMNYKLVHNPNVPPRQSEAEIKAILEEAQGKRNGAHAQRTTHAIDAQVDEYMDNLDML